MFAGSRRRTVLETRRQGCSWWRLEVGQSSIYHALMPIWKWRFIEIYVLRRTVIRTAKAKSSAKWATTVGSEYFGTMACRTRTEWAKKGSTTWSLLQAWMRGTTKNPIAMSRVHTMAVSFFRCWWFEIN